MLESRKYSIIEWIISVADEKVIDTLQSIKEHIESQKVIDSNRQYVYSTSTYKDVQSRKVNLEQLKKEQKYKPTSGEELTLIAEEANIEQSIEALLADLKAMG
jgi:hypothetical protein